MTIILSESLQYETRSYFYSAIELRNRVKPIIKQKADFHLSGDKYQRAD